MVIDTIEASDGVQDQSAVVMSRQFFTLRDSIDGRAAQFVALRSRSSDDDLPVPDAARHGVTLGFAGFACCSPRHLIF